MIRISIHPTELKFESKAIRKWVKENASIEIYPKGLRRGKRFDKATEFRARVREYLKEIEKNKGKESNIEGIIVDMLIELLHRMMLQDIRKLNLWKLV